MDKMLNNLNVRRGVKWGIEALAFEGLFKLISYAANGIKADFEAYYAEQEELAKSEPTEETEVEEEEA